MREILWHPRNATSSETRPPRCALASTASLSTGPSWSSCRTSRISSRRCLRSWLTRWTEIRGTGSWLSWWLKAYPQKHQRAVRSRAAHARLPSSRRQEALRAEPRRTTSSRSSKNSSVSTTSRIDLIRSFFKAQAAGKASKLDYIKTTCPIQLVSVFLNFCEIICHFSEK